ncbi:MAG: YqgE/AlgH family protein, partial [Alphaproteobacteria bacterium]|nr:YqgE/AlgH family protein [Alphaproteobacteria bacterium]
GPVDAARGFVLHSCEYARSETVLMQNGIALTSNIQVLRDMAVGMGPKKSLLALGYAGWTAGQLEAEIEANSWLTVPATPDLVFDTANDLKWNHSALSVGVDISKLSGQAGHA